MPLNCFIYPALIIVIYFLVKMAQLPPPLYEALTKYWHNAIKAIKYLIGEKITKTVSYHLSAQCVTPCTPPPLPSL